MRTAILSLLLVLASGTAPVPPARAAWAPDGFLVSPTPSSTAPESWVHSDAASAGTIVAWVDARSGINRDIYAQRLDRLGAKVWSQDVGVCTAAADQLEPFVLADGSGGAFIAWIDERSGGQHVYAQHVDGTGMPLWVADGATVSTTGTNTQDVRAVLDTVGGIIVMFTRDDDIYAQRIGAGGIRLWPAAGVAVRASANVELGTSVVADGAGGAIFAWHENRGADYDIYTQRVDSGGVLQWPATGVVLCGAAGDQLNPVLVREPAGAIAAWSDGRAGQNGVYARRVTLGGAPAWQADGVAVRDSSATLFSVGLVADGDGGAIAAWADSRAGLFLQSAIYAQRIDTNGNPLWLDQGVGISDASGDQDLGDGRLGLPGAGILADGDGGAVFVFETPADGRLLAQRIAPDGGRRWGASGTPLSSGPWSFSATAGALSDGAVIAAWLDDRSGPGNRDLYAQRVEIETGQWGHPEPSLAAVTDNAGDQGGTVLVTWDASSLDTWGQQSVTHYSVWRADAAGSGAATPFRPGSVPASGDGFAWEWVGNQDAQRFADYGFLAATRQDSLSTSTSMHAFLVVAHTADPFTYWVSQPDSGYSVDNLAPGPPLQLAAVRGGSDVALSWSPPKAVPDLRDYAVYRAGSPGVPVAPASLVATTADTVFTDAGVPGGALYYVVTATDIHENEGSPSVEANVQPVTGATGLAGTGLGLVVAPNPFASAAEIRFRLPDEGPVAIEVFDTAGRRLRADHFGRLEAGAHTLAIRRGLVGSAGVYVVRIRSSARTESRKVTILN